MKQHYSVTTPLKEMMSISIQVQTKFYEFTVAFWLRMILPKSDKRNNIIAILELPSRVQQVSSKSYVCFLTIAIINSTNERPYSQIDW